MKKNSFRSYALFNICAFCLALSSIAYGMKKNEIEQNIKEEEATLLTTLMLDNETNAFSEVCFCPDTKTIFIASDKGKSVKRINLYTQKEIQKIEAPLTDYYFAYFFYKNDLLHIIWQKDSTKQTLTESWKLDEKKKEYVLLEKYNDDNDLFEFEHSKDFKEISVYYKAEKNKERSLVQKITYKKTSTNKNEKISDYCDNEKSKRFAICASDGALQIFQWNDNKKEFECIKDVLLSDNKFNNIFFNHDGTYLLASSKNSKQIIIEKFNKEKKTYEPFLCLVFKDNATILDCHSKENIFAVAQNDGLICIFRLP